MDAWMDGDDTAAVCLFISHTHQLSLLSLSLCTLTYFNLLNHSLLTPHRSCCEKVKTVLAEILENNNMKTSMDMDHQTPSSTPPHSTTTTSTTSPYSSIRENVRQMQETLLNLA